MKSVSVKLTVGKLQPVETADRTRMSSTALNFLSGGILSINSACDHGLV